MKTYRLTRDLALDYGTFGKLVVDGTTYQTVERPWLNNAPNVSCIPPGTYRAHLRETTTNHAAGLDHAYELQGVPGRSVVELHVANYPTDVRGCIGLGTGRAFVGGRYMVTLSVQAVQNFYTRLKGEPFFLEIT